MRGLGGRIADVPDNAGLNASEQQVGIEMYLKPELAAMETIFARKDRKFKDKREVVAGHPRIAALRTLFELHGSYAPRDPKEAGQYGVDTIRVDLPRSSGEFNQFQIAH